MRRSCQHTAVSPLLPSIDTRIARTGLCGFHTICPLSFSGPASMKERPSLDHATLPFVTI